MCRLLSVVLVKDLKIFLQCVPCPRTEHTTAFKVLLMVDKAFSGRGLNCTPDPSSRPLRSPAAGLSVPGARGEPGEAAFRFHAPTTCS